MSAPNKSYDPVEVEALKPENIERMRDEALAAFAAAADLDALAQAKTAHAGGTSPLSLANREIGALPPQAKAEAGKRVGMARGQVNKALAARQAVLEAERDERVLVEEAVDVTLPYDRVPAGARGCAASPSSARAARAARRPEPVAHRRANVPPAPAPRTRRGIRRGVVPQQVRCVRQALPDRQQQYPLHRQFDQARRGPRLRDHRRLGRQRLRRQRRRSEHQAAGLRHGSGRLPRRGRRRGLRVSGRGRPENRMRGRRRYATVPP